MTTRDEATYAILGGTSYLAGKIVDAIDLEAPSRKGFGMQNGVLVQRMDERVFSMPDSRQARGWMSVVGDRLEGVRLRVKDFDGNLCEYLATPSGQSFCSMFSCEKELSPEMLRILREAYEQWFLVTRL